MKRTLIEGRIVIVLLLGSGMSAVKAQNITEFTFGNIGNTPAGIVAGPDGNLWFTEPSSYQIGRMTTAGESTEFPGGNGHGIAAGLDGNLWFTESLILSQQADQIGRITPAGVVAHFPIPTPHSRPGSIAAGPDGNLWFTEPGSNKIGRISPTGVVREFAIPSANSNPGSIAAGPDHKLWFTESDGNKIGRIDLAGVITEFAIPSAGGNPSGIAAGPDGNLWFTEYNANRIGRITLYGVITEFEIPSPVSNPSGIAAGPDGNLWFTESNYNRIGRITTSPCPPDPRSLCLSGGRFQATATYRNPLGSGAAAAHGLSDSSGFFTFDNPDSVELVVKVLNACSFTPNIWVFAAGLTNQEVLLTVTDTKTRDVQTYSNPLGTTFVTVTDTTAFSTCP
jgi:streptogramin lyase